MIACTQSGNGTSLCFARSWGSLPNSVGWEHSQTLVVVATCHDSSHISSSTETFLQISVPHYVYPIDRHKLWEKIWGEYLLGIVLEYPSASWLQRVNNGSTIEDFGTDIGCMLHRWRNPLLCSPARQILILVEIDPCLIWMAVMASFHAQRPDPGCLA